MPRPKRTKVASATTRVAKTSKDADPVPRQQQVSKPSNRIDSISDDSDGLVVKSTRPRRRMPWHPEPQKDVDLTMSGALPVDHGEEDVQKSGRIQGRVQSPRVVIPLESQRTSSSNASKKTRATSGGTKASSPGTSPAECRPTTSTVPDTPVGEDDSTSFGDNFLTFTSLDSDSLAHGTRPPSAMKVGATPAHETSILALTNFRRRARQPSLLRMVHQTTDVEDNDLDDLDDFHPDDESTPFRLHESGREEEARKTTGLGLSSSGSRGKKRKLSSPIVQIPRSSPPYDLPSGVDGAKSRSSSPSLPDVVDQSREELVENEEQADPEIMSETMAPPRSSSPPVDEIEDPPDSPVKYRQRRKRGASKKASGDQDSEGDELDRPTKPKTRNKSKARHGISTAKLQALLPRRRTRVPQERDEYEVQSSDEVNATPIDSDQDELQLPPPRQASTARNGAALKSSKKSTRALKKSVIPVKAAQKNTRTYSRRTSSDKENESTYVVDADSGEVEETTETSIALPKPKLAAIAKKFEDVDAWEMDFESVDVGGESSSPWR